MVRNGGAGGQTRLSEIAETPSYSSRLPSRDAVIALEHRLQTWLGKEVER